MRKSAPLRTNELIEQMLTTNRGRNIVNTLYNIYIYIRNIRYARIEIIFEENIFEFDTYITSNCYDTFSMLLYNKYVYLDLVSSVLFFIWLLNVSSFQFVRQKLTLLKVYPFVY